MNNNQQDIALFLSFCIEQYKAAKGMTGKEAMQELDRYGVLEYLSEFYDVLHTQGRQWIRQILKILSAIINRRKSNESVPW